MELIVDAGSTKSEWLLTDNYLTLNTLRTPGINPFFQTQSNIEQLIATHIAPHIDTQNIRAVHFYGAGCTPKQKSIVVDALQSSFAQAQCEVHSDLLGAARALLQHEQGIACILGTGSNSCLYNEGEIALNISPLGFILGDEGSGAHLGKQLVADHLKHQMPEHLSENFAEQYPMTQEQIVAKVYKEPFPNRFLAQFAPFLSANITEPYCYNLVFDGFLAFFVRNIAQYPHYKELPVAFVGSVAHHFADVLEVACYDFGLNFHHIERSPLEGLQRYHQQL